MTREEVKAMRAKAGMTQKRLAEVLNVSKRTVEEWESGRRTPGRRSMMDINKFIEETFSVEVSE